MGCLNRFEFGGLLESVWVQWVVCRFGCGFFLVLVSGGGERWRDFFWDFLFVVDGDGGGDGEYGYLISRLNRRVWPIYRYGAHKQLKNLSDDKLSDGAKRVGCRELGYFKWWVMSDKWQKLSKEWWVMKKKSKQDLSILEFSYSSLGRVD